MESEEKKNIEEEKEEVVLKEEEQKEKEETKEEEDQQSRRSSRRARLLKVRRKRLASLTKTLEDYRSQLDYLNERKRAAVPPMAAVAAESVVVDVRPRSTSTRAESASTSASVKHEATVMSRIHRLQAEGIWMGKKLPKANPEPEPPKAHWGYVLEEMKWLSSVFQQEIKTKKALSKKCGRMVQKHFQDRRSAQTRAEKQDEMARRKVAAFMAREVRQFWGNIQKLFEYRLQSQLEVKRKQALDVHLNMIVDKTEKFSSLLAESLGDMTPSLKTTPAASDVESVSSKGAASPGDLEYEPDGSSDDNEETISQDDDKQEEGELDMLQQEQDIPVEELLRRFHPELYPPDDDDEEDKDKSEDKKDPEPKAGTSKQKEDDTSKNSEEGDKKDKVDKKKAAESDQDSDDEDDDGNEEEDNDEEEDEEDEKQEKKEKGSASKETEEDDSENLKALVAKDDDDKVEGAKEQEGFYDAIEMAEQFQPTGNTLETTVVKTPIPFLLKHTLREYQHIGLDWLVSLHERNFNGILADEMGLGKTIQTISLLAHLACEKEVWGPHLIVVPTSVMLNWEMEIKKWCPAFKVLTYYGTQKERKAKRVGWTKDNAFHVCITSYKLVIQDHQSFRRKQWYYFILDEAQHIKNFKSQRWQLLLNFSSRGRLLLTGTPLQNNLMELWSLMHFLMPDVFQSHRNFKEWFSNPLTGMVEDSAEYNESLVKRLHKVLRPFLLRRLKSEVEKQLPKKYEHIVYCNLSKRQRFLYDDFMSRAKTKETLEGGNFMSVINVLMQLRKVCNHPNLFEPRPTLSPFICESLSIRNIPKHLYRVLAYDPLGMACLDTHPLNLLAHELTLSGFAAHSIMRLQRKKFKPDPPKCPDNLLRMTMAPYKPPDPPKPIPGYIPHATVVNNNIWKKKKTDLNIKIEKGTFLLTSYNNGSLYPEDLTLEEFVPVKSSSSYGQSYIAGVKRARSPKKPTERPKGIALSKIFRGVDNVRDLKRDYTKVDKLEMIQRLNHLKAQQCPLYGSDLRECVMLPPLQSVPRLFLPATSGESLHDHTMYNIGIRDQMSPVAEQFLKKFHLYVPTVLCFTPDSNDKSSLRDNVDSEDKVTEQRKTNSGIDFQIQLPEARLIQYDCGKLQILSGLLVKLKAGGHRALIFTQMTKVLDILESFLNYHGYIYLRLDGSTRVEQRQALMERFNGSNKYFIFILSTRSGGVGINLTGADTVIFYDSDWNPTMDAQAQDRCHRIGQTRDVHIYRLVSERTVEENILKKANQKRLLGDLAIEGGNFTTAQLKSNTIKDLFNVEDQDGKGTATRGIETTVVVTNDDGGGEGGSSAAAPKQALGAFESAISAVEDKTDKEVINAARIFN